MTRTQGCRLEGRVFAFPLVKPGVARVTCMVCSKGHLTAYSSVELLFD